LPEITGFANIFTVYVIAPSLIEINATINSYKGVKQ